MYTEEVIYRPPREANSLLLPLTSGCSHNRCTFCNMYRGVPFRVHSIDDIRANLKRFALYRPQADRIYLLGGDPFVLSADKLHRVIDEIHDVFPAMKTITMYAQVANITTKSDAELYSLRQRGVNQLYIGLETGDDALLQKLDKGNSAAEAVEQLNRLTAAGMTYGVIIMTGIAGKGGGIKNAIATAKVMNQIHARVLYCNSLVVQADTPLGEEERAGTFTEAGEYERIEELLALLEHLKPQSKLLFNSYHVSNTLSINVELPEGQAETIERLKLFLAGTTPEKMEQRFQRRGMRI